MQECLETMCTNKTVAPTLSTVGTLTELVCIRLVVVFCVVWSCYCGVEHVCVVVVVRFVGFLCAESLQPSKFAILLRFRMVTKAILKVEMSTFRFPKNVDPSSVSYEMRNFRSAEWCGIYRPGGHETLKRAICAERVSHSGLVRYSGT